MKPKVKVLTIQKRRTLSKVLGGLGFLTHIVFIGAVVLVYLKLYFILWTTIGVAAVSYIWSALLFQKISSEESGWVNALQLIGTLNSLLCGIGLVLLNSFFSPIQHADGTFIFYGWIYWLALYAAGSDFLTVFVFLYECSNLGTMPPITAKNTEPDKVV